MCARVSLLLCPLTNERVSQHLRDCPHSANEFIDYFQVKCDFAVIERTSFGFDESTLSYEKRDCGIEM